MLLLNKPLLDDCKKRHAHLGSAIERFILIVESARWMVPGDIKDSFGRHSDQVGPYWCMDIGGKKGARVIVAVQFSRGTVVIDRIFTNHARYMLWTKEIRK